MSALFLRRRQPYEIAHAWEPCSNGCVHYEGGSKSPLTHRGRRSAFWEAELMGRHAAWLCEACQRVWRAGWSAAGGGVPVVDGRWGAAVEEAA